MTVTVIEAGPVKVCGPGLICPERATAAVDCIDDRLALIDDEPIAVDELWIEVLERATGAPPEKLIVICPSWWTGEQSARVQRAADTLVADVVMLRRDEVLSGALPGQSWAVIELAGELIRVSRAGADPVTLSSHAELDTLAARVADAAGGVDEIILDAVGDDPLVRAVTERLRDRGATVSVSDADLVHRGAIACAVEPVLQPENRRRSGGGRRAAAGALVGAALCAAVAVRPAPTPTLTPLVEGRVGLQVPARWTVQRVTGGRGSDRVQVISSTDPTVVLHLTQSATTGQSVADTLRGALDEQPAGVFVDFNPADRIAGRQVVSYREIRPGREIQWAVLADKAVRIAIGCQSAAGHRDSVREACEVAVRSAHAVF